MKESKAPEIRSIGREAALALAASKWWENQSHREIAEFQLLTNELCMNFGDFQEAVEKTLGRPVWTHEFALNRDGIIAEMFDGKPAPTFDEILNLIPADKRIAVVVGK